MDGEFAHAPGFVGGGGGGLVAGALDLGVVGVDIIYAEVGEIAVAAELAGVQVVGAFAEHDEAVVFFDEDPARGSVDDFEAEDVDVEAGRDADVVDGEDIMVLEDGGHGVLCGGLGGGGSDAADTVASGGRRSKGRVIWRVCGTGETTKRRRGAKAFYAGIWLRDGWRLSRMERHTKG
jgi:hypothetical protein